MNFLKMNFVGSESRIKPANTVRWAPYRRSSRVDFKNAHIASCSVSVRSAVNITRRMENNPQVSFTAKIVEKSCNPAQEFNSSCVTISKGRFTYTTAVFGTICTVNLRDGITVTEKKDYVEVQIGGSGSSRIIEVHPHHSNQVFQVACALNCQLGNRDDGHKQRIFNRRMLKFADCNNIKDSIDSIGSACRPTNVPSQLSGPIRSQSSQRSAASKSSQRPINPKSSLPEDLKTLDITKCKCKKCKDIFSIGLLQNAGVRGYTCGGNCGFSMILKQDGQFHCQGNCPPGSIQVSNHDLDTLFCCFKCKKGIRYHNQ